MSTEPSARARPLARLTGEVDRLATATPADRDRWLDLLRVGSIGVVIVWHWALSITQWDGGALTMPNPIDHVPYIWLATWVLQIMPVFFLVGGAVDLRAWRSLRRRGAATAWGFLRGRAWRLLVPPAVFAATWVVLELVLAAVRDDHRSVLEWGAIVFVPLWFLGAYAFVVVLVPLTARWHDRARWPTFAALVVLLAAADIARFAADIGAAGYLASALVWITIHQLGYLLDDGTLDRLDRRGQWLFVGAALAVVAVLTGVGPYPGSMVTTQVQEVSNMWPTTAVLVAVATLQLGLIVLLRPALTRWLQRRLVWKVVVAANLVVMTVFVWHMVAKVVVIGIYGWLGFELIDEPTLAWWAQRPLWLFAPIPVLAVLVAVFAPFEVWSRRR